MQAPVHGTQITAQGFHTFSQPSGLEIAQNRWFNIHKLLMNILIVVMS